ncbi:MAG TPA: hypothetical protein VIU93_07520 [Gallionellaceae bacterium]
MSKITQLLAATAVLFTLSVSAHAADATMKADNQAVDSACKAEAQTAGCGSEVVGKGLLKCMGAYKKAHKDFKYSEGCRDAMKQRREDHKAEKAAK